MSTWLIMSSGSSISDTSCFKSYYPNEVPLSRNQHPLSTSTDGSHVLKWQNLGAKIRTSSPGARIWFSRWVLRERRMKQAHAKS